jgi:hypothetical protein
VCFWIGERDKNEKEELNSKPFGNARISAFAKDPIPDFPDNSHYRKS